MTIGWSTHEKPEEFMPASLAYASGARMFEKHVGIKSSKYKLNEYSIHPELFEKWYDHLAESISILGEGKKIITKNEIETLNKLQRGVYVKQNLKKNEILNKKNCYFAFPLQKNQLSSADLKDRTILLKNKNKDDLVYKKDIAYNEDLIKEYRLRSYIHELKAILNYNKITIPEVFDMEISHHDGIENFRKLVHFYLILLIKVMQKNVSDATKSSSPNAFSQKKMKVFIFYLEHSYPISTVKERFCIPVIYFI